MPSVDVKRNSTSRRTASLTRTQITINVYDLLQPGRLSGCLWHLGASCLHSGVVIGDKEYAYGYHDKAGVSGVYWTRPGQEPPGGYFRMSVVQGFTFRSQAEIDQVIRAASHHFQGSNWSLLKNNCNHFTSHLCQTLTGRPAPPWLNRAATIASACPCLIPHSWLEAPDAETADGELVDEEPNLDDIDEADEESGMLQHRQPDPVRQSSDSTRRARPQDSSNRDATGKTVSVSDRAPAPQ